MATQLVELGLALVVVKAFLNEKQHKWLRWSSGIAAVLLVIDPVVALLNWLRHLVPLS